MRPLSVEFGIGTAMPVDVHAAVDVHVPLMLDELAAVRGRLTFVVQANVAVGTPGELAEADTTYCNTSETDVPLTVPVSVFD